MLEEHVPTLEQGLLFLLWGLFPKVADPKEQVNHVIDLPLLSEIHRYERWILSELLYVE